MDTEYYIQNLRRKATARGRDRREQGRERGREREGEREREGGREGGRERGREGERHSYTRQVLYECGVTMSSLFLCWGWVLLE